MATFLMLGSAPHKKGVDFLFLWYYIIIIRIKEPEYLYSNPKLYEKITKLIAYYDGQKANITKSRLEGVVLNPGGWA